MNRRPPSPAWRIAAPIAVLFAIAAIVIAPLIGSGVIAGFKDPTPAQIDRASASTTDELLKRVRSIACLPFTYKHTSVDADMDAASRVLTGSAAKDFELARGKTAQLVRTNRQSSSCSVDTAGLIELDGRTAQALVALTITTDLADTAPSSTRTTIRSTLTKHNDTWLISAFDTID